MVLRPICWFCARMDSKQPGSGKLSGGKRSLRCLTRLLVKWILVGLYRLFYLLLYCFVTSYLSTCYFLCSNVVL
jgi:hypothetical protein